MIDQYQITRELVTPQYIPAHKYPKTSSQIPNSVPKSCQFPFKQTKPHTLLSSFQVQGGVCVFPYFPNVSV